MKTVFAALIALSTVATLSATSAYARQGADDAAGHTRQGRGKDDGAKHTMIKGDDSIQMARRGRGGHDDGANHA